MKQELLRRLLCNRNVKQNNVKLLLPTMHERKMVLGNRKIPNLAVKYWGIEVGCGKCLKLRSTNRLILIFCLYYKCCVTKCQNKIDWCGQYFGKEDIGGLAWTYLLLGGSVGLGDAQTPPPQSKSGKHCWNGYPENTVVCCSIPSTKYLTRLTRDCNVILHHLGAHINFTILVQINQYLHNYWKHGLTISSNLLSWQNCYEHVFLYFTSICDFTVIELFMPFIVNRYPSYCFYTPVASFNEYLLSRVAMDMLY